jgi:hypothetical protein
MIVCLYSFLCYQSYKSHIFCVIILSLWPILIYHIFPHLSHKRHPFGEKIIEYKMYVLISKTLAEIFLTSEDFSEI